MAHNFLKGIDWIADPTGATALTNHRFVSKSGNDANTGLDPNNPKLTIQSALLLMIANDILIIGTGVYQEENLSLSQIYLVGDGRVVLKGNGINYIANVEISYFYCDSLTIDGYLSTNSSTGMRNTFLTKCLIRNLVFKVTTNVTSLEFEDCIVKNVDFTREAYQAQTGHGSGFNRSSFFNCTGYCGSSYVKNCLFEGTQMYIVKATGVNTINYVYNNCVRGAVTVIDKFLVTTVTYANLADQIIARPEFNINSFNSDPLLKGLYSNEEYQIENSSPLIAAGVSGVTIGGLKIGYLGNSTSTEFGTTPQLNTNTVFTGYELGVVAGLEGRRETSSVNLGQIIEGVTINSNMVFDALNNTPDVDNTLVNPNHLTFEAQWAGNDEIFNGAWKKFRFGIPMAIDGNGKYSGENGYVLSGTVLISAKYLKIAIVPRNDYVAV